jgi:RHS repeat-associated protein
VTRFVWRSGHVLYETSPGGTITVSYQWGMGTDDLVAVHDHATGAHYYVVQDKLRSVRGLVHRDGTWVASWRYRAYGVVLDSAGSAPAGLTRFRWAGAQWDAETGFYFLRTRYYDPPVGRFVQEDKLGRAGGANLYAYAGGRPLAARDPAGTYASDDAVHFHFYWERLQVTYSCISWCDSWNPVDLLTYMERNASYERYYLAAQKRIKDTNLDRYGVVPLSTGEYEFLLRGTVGTVRANAITPELMQVVLGQVEASFAEGKIVMDFVGIFTQLISIRDVDGIPIRTAYAVTSGSRQITLLNPDIMRLDVGWAANIIVHEAQHLYGVSSECQAYLIAFQATGVRNAPPGSLECTRFN